MPSAELPCVNTIAGTDVIAWYHGGPNRWMDENNSRIVGQSIQEKGFDAVCIDSFLATTESHDAVTPNEPLIYDLLSPLSEGTLVVAGDFLTERALAQSFEAIQVYRKTIDAAVLLASTAVFSATEYIAWRQIQSGKAKTMSRRSFIVQLSALCTTLFSREVTSRIFESVGNQVGHEQSAQINACAKGEFVARNDSKDVVDRNSLLGYKMKYVEDVRKVLVLGSAHLHPNHIQSANTIAANVDILNDRLHQVLSAEVEYLASLGISRSEIQKSISLLIDDMKGFSVLKTKKAPGRIDLVDAKTGKNTCTRYIIPDILPDKNDIIHSLLRT